MYKSHRKREYLSGELVVRVDLLVKNKLESIECYLLSIQQRESNNLDHIIIKLGHYYI